ncbi:MAG: hypothetical protein JXA18_01155 [Chitinispirillaceae bacterium]|nr:hypothetical protein [Chitinispirillaceae bacterium]
MMKRALFFLSFTIVFLLLMLCELPQDPETIVENSNVELAIDSLSADSSGMYHDTLGDCISFQVNRILGNLIDSFIVDFGDDSSIVFSTDEFQEDTFDFEYCFTSTGAMLVGISIYRTDGTVRRVDSVVIIDIVNRRPAFLEGRPDTAYAADDGDSIIIPLQAIDTDGETIEFFIGDKEVPESATVEIVGDTSLVVVTPYNTAGVYGITVEVSDGVDTVATTVTLSISDRTPPNPPRFLSPSIVTTTTPLWEWEPGGNSGNGVYRYVLDNNDFSGDKGTETDTTFFRSPSSLIEGTHTLFIQERDSSGNWSKTASWAILIDQTGPEAPQVTGTTPTNDRTPTWTWIGSGAEEPVFRFKLDSAKFTAADTIDTTATSFSPDEELDEGDHTLYVKERDEAGNWSASGSFTIRIDITGPQAPTVTAVTPTANRRPEWTWTANGGGKGYFRCALDSNVFSGNESFTSALTYIASADLEEGEHTLYVQEQDTVGNWSSSGSFAVTIDVTPPGAPVFTSKTAQDTLQPEWTWTSGGGGSGKYRYRRDDEDLAGITPIATTSYRAPENLTEGPHTLFLQEIDSTGNWSAVVSQVIIVDTLPPAAPEVTGDVLTNNPKPTWTWTSGAGGDGNYRLKIDANDLESSAISSDTTAYTPDDDLDEGAHWFYLQERDAAGNWSKTDSFMTTIDLTPPDTPTVLGSLVTNSLRPAWSWSSGGGGIGEYRYRLDSDDLSEEATVTSSTNFTPEDDLAVGDHALYVQERDAAGNWSATGSYTTTIDTTAAGAPSVAAVSPTNDTTPTWSWTSGGGAETYRYKLDSQDFTEGATETTDLSFTPGSALSEGVHILFVQEIDDAGNWSATGLCVVQIDLTPPSSPSISGVSPTNDLTPAWSWESVDGAGVFRFKLDDDDLTTGATETDETSFAPAADLAAGSHTLHLQERDAAGNWSATESLAVVIDTTPPAAPVVSGTTPTNDRTPLWTWISGGGGGNETFRYKLDDADFDETSAFQYLPDDDLSEGSHTLYVQERDAAGNWSESGEKAIVIDITPPGAPTVTGDALTNDPTPTWSWTSGGGGNGQFRFKLDDADLSTGATSTEVSSYTPPSALSEASHTLYVQERDTVGNWSSSGSYAVTIDVTKPGKPAFISGTTGSPSGSTSLTWKWQSGGDGNGTFRYKRDSGGWTDLSGTTYSATLGEGLHTLSIAERDDAGNWSDSASRAIYVLPAPSNLEAELVIGHIKGEGGVKLTWANNADAYDSIHVYRLMLDCEIKCRPVKIKTLGKGTTEFLDTKVDTCESYRYYVAAYLNGVGSTESPWSKDILVGTPEACKGFIRIMDPIIRIDPITIDPILIKE